MNAPAARPEEDAEILELHRAGNKDGLLPIAERLIWAQFWKSVYANVVTPEQREEMVRSALVEVLALLRREEGKNPWDPAKGSLATLIYQPVLGAFAETAVSTALIPRRKANASKGAANPDDGYLAELPDEDPEKKFEPWHEALEYEKAEEEALKQCGRFRVLLEILRLRGVPKINSRTGKPVPDSFAADFPGIDDKIAAEAGCLKRQGRTPTEIMQTLGRSQASVYRDLRAADDYLESTFDSMPAYLHDALGWMLDHWTEIYRKQYEHEDPAEIDGDDESGVSDPETEWQPAPKLTPSR